MMMVVYKLKSPMKTPYLFEEEKKNNYILLVSQRSDAEGEVGYDAPCIGI